MHPGRRRQPGLGLMLLFYQLFGVIGIDRIPPVTLSIIGLQVAIFLRLFRLPWYKASQVCISAYRVWKKKEFIRLLYGALEHGDDWHLYYNMLSFAVKGQSLERRLGSLKFLYTVFCFTVLTNCVLVALIHLTSENFYEYDQCAIGFSGVIFALKVLTTYYDTNYTHQVMGIPLMVPGRYAVWIELLLIQLFVPNASFLGHLSGILVGMAYVKGPLKYMMDLIYSTVAAVALPSSASRPRFTPHAQPTGYAYTSSHQNFSDYVPPNMSEEEQIRRAMEESLHQEFHSGYSTTPPYPNSFSFENSASYSSPPPPGFVFDDNVPPPPPPGFVPDIDEIRSRRQAHFSNLH